MTYSHSLRGVSGIERDHLVILQNGLTLAVLLAERIKAAITRIEEAPQPTWASRLYPAHWLMPAQSTAQIRQREQTPREQPTAQTTAPTTSKTSSIRTPICEGVYVLAIHVEGFDDVQNNGLIHYVTAHHTFAVYVNGTMLTGNVGEIGGCRALRTAPCKYGEKCTKRPQCTWYHDPVKCGGSDRHDYTVASMVYVGRRAGTRTVGGRSTLASDMSAINELDVITARARAMHELLIAAALTTPETLR